MPTYPIYKFTDIASLIRGVSYDKSVVSTSEREGYIPVLRANNIQKDLVLNDLVYVPSDFVKEEQMIRKGDIVLAMSSGSKDLVGKSAQADKDINAAFGTFCGLIRAKENIDSKFLGLYFQTQEYRNFVSYQSKGVNICNLKKKDIESLQIPLPLLPTQRAIVARIESLFAELDKAVQHLRTAQQQLKTYRQAVLNHWLNNDDGKWEMVKLGEVAEIKRGRSKHRPRNDKSLFGGKYPFIQTGEIREANGGTITTYTQTYSEKGLEQSRLWPKGTLCLTIAANIAETAYLGFDACFPDSVVGILAQNDKLNLEYFNLFIQLIKQEIENKASATAQKNINVDFLENLEVSLPPLAEQHRIVQEIESRLSQAEAAEASIAEALQKTEALRQSILKKAFSGELVVSTSSTNTFPQSSTTSKGG